MDKQIIIVGAGVAGINAATELVDNGYPGELITMIDMGKDPYNRKPEEVMCGFGGAGAWSDGKLTYHTSIGGHLSKYCGEEKAMELMDRVIDNFRRFHPEPSDIQCSDPDAEPEFIKPYFNLRLFPVWHIGTDYLHQIMKNWYDYLCDKGVRFAWETKIDAIDFENQMVIGKQGQTALLPYDHLIFGVGKSGIDFGKQLIEENELPTEPKPVQIGVRFEAPQKHFQNLIDISYDFKLYRKFDEDGISLRTFCTNNNAAYVAVENTYGDHSYNGHAKKGAEHRNDMTNFGILMEIRGIDKPFEFSREVVNGLQKMNTGLFYSPKQTRKPTNTSEGKKVSCEEIESMEIVYKYLGGYTKFIMDFINDMKKVFPTLQNDWGIYIPEVKYLSPEPLVNYSDLSLTKYSNVYFVGDALSARGITVSGSQGIYVAESLIKNEVVNEKTNTLS